MSAWFMAVLMRDLRLAARRRIESLLPLVFFVVAVSLFPLGVGPEPQTLRLIAPGVVWVCALLASMLSVTLNMATRAEGFFSTMISSCLTLASEVEAPSGTTAPFSAMSGPVMVTSLLSVGAPTP